MRALARLRAYGNGTCAHQRQNVVIKGVRGKGPRAPRGPRRDRARNPAWPINDSSRAPAWTMLAGKHALDGWPSAPAQSSTIRRGRRLYREARAVPTDQRLPELVRQHPSATSPADTSRAPEGTERPYYSILSAARREGHGHRKRIGRSERMSAASPRSRASSSGAQKGRRPAFASGRGASLGAVARSGDARIA